MTALHTSLSEEHVLIKGFAIFGRCSCVSIMRFIAPAPQLFISHYIFCMHQYHISYTRCTVFSTYSTASAQCSVSIQTRGGNCQLQEAIKIGPKDSKNIPLYLAANQECCENVLMWTNA